MSYSHLLKFYNHISEMKTEREEQIEVLQELDRDILMNSLEYRIQSTIRVLNYIKEFEELNKELDIDLGHLISHCLAKLSGNIDGIELDLDEREEMEE